MKKDDEKKTNQTLPEEELKEEATVSGYDDEEIPEEEEEELEELDEGIKEFRVLEYGFMVPLTVDKMMKAFGNRRFDIPSRDGMNRVLIDTKPNIALIGDGRFYAQFDFVNNRLMSILLQPAGATSPEEAKMYSEGILREAFGQTAFMHEMFRWFVVEDKEKPFGSDSTGMIRIELYPKLNEGKK